MISPPPTPPKPPSARDIALDASILAAIHPSARLIRAHDQPNANTTTPSPNHRTIHLQTRSPIPLTSRRYPEHYHSILKSFSLTLLPTQTGKTILRSTYNSALAIHNTLPHHNFVPKPLAWGTLTSDPDMHFLLTHYHAVDGNVRLVERFAEGLARLHLESARQNNVGMCGFHVTTFSKEGIPQLNRRTETWEEWVYTNLSHLFELEIRLNGPATTEMVFLTHAVLKDVLPRLLRPLETYPNKLTKCLLHGNLTPDNISTSLHTRGPITFSPCAFYGHNEYDLAALVDGKYERAIEVYQKIVPRSEPRGDFEGRMGLYKIVGLVRGCCAGEGRGGMVRVMRRLVERYGGCGKGCEGEVEVVASCVG